MKRAAIERSGLGMPICACTETPRFARAYSSRVASEKRSGLEGVAVRVAGYVTATNWVMYRVCGNGARSRSMAKACSQWRAALSIEAFITQFGQLAGMI